MLRSYLHRHRSFCYTSIIRYSLIFFITFFLFHCNTSHKEEITKPPVHVGPQPDGSVLVPTNQFLRPAGFQIQFAGRPVDLAMSPDGRWLAVLNIKSLDLIRLYDRTLIQSLKIQGGGSYHGVAFSEDSRRIFVSQARDRILVAEMNTDNVLTWADKIVFSRPSVGGHPVPGGMVLDEKNGRLLAILNRSNTLAVVNLSDKSISEIPVGVAPYEVLMISDDKAYVTDWGGRQPKEGESTYLTSKSSILIDPATGVANNGAVSVVDLDDKKVIKTIDVGLHPNAMVLSNDKQKLFVACANSDIISVIDTKTDKVIHEISLKTDDKLPFGLAPNALAFSPDGKQLFVANGTQNALCVIDLATNKIAGLIPTAWYPGAVLFDKGGKYVIVTNIKGIGSRHNKAGQYGYNTHNHSGSISVIPVPDKNGLKSMTKTVKKNNAYTRMMEELNKKGSNSMRLPVPVLPGQKSHFKHVVYIIKENRTYDQVFGDMPEGNGDTTLLMFGEKVTPNHHALAREFVLLDNFYCSGVLSADGHQWTDEAYATDYLEKFFGDFPRSYPYDGGDAMAYSPTGFIWDNVKNHGLTYRNYGEFVDAVIEPRNATFTDIYNDFINGTGKITIRAKNNLPQMEPYTCPTYVGFPNTVPDQYRAKEFIKELKEYEKNGNFPNFIIMLLPNDHTSGTRPGTPTPEAAVADNDLALGKIVEAISHSKFWKETCILVTQDDPQAGLDHVDGHRTVGMVISPYTRRGAVVSTYYTQINMFRTIENILGIPPLNRFDLTAEPMNDCFTDEPDFTPYTALPNNIPLDTLNPELTSLSGDALHWARKSMAQDLDDYDRIDEDTFNRIIWHAVKGYDVPYPVLKN